MKIRPHWTRTVFSFLFFAFLLLLLLYLGLGSKAFPPKKEDWLLLSIWFIGSGAFLGLSLSSSYYYYDKKGLYYKSFRKLYFYPFQDILYIDQPRAQKSSVLIFVTKTGKKITLTLDRKKEILQVLLKRCPTLLEKEEILLRFPNIRP